MLASIQDNRTRVSVGVACLAALGMLGFIARERVRHLYAAVEIAAAALLSMDTLKHMDLVGPPTPGESIRALAGIYVFVRGFDNMAHAYPHLRTWALWPKALPKRAAQASTVLE